MAEWAGPGVGVVWVAGEFPAVVFEFVVVAAEWGEVGEAGWSVVGPWVAVVEVGCGGGHAASGEDAVWVGGLGVGFDGCGGSAVEGAGGDGGAVVGDGVGPFAVVVGGDGLSGDFGDDWGGVELAGVVGEEAEGL